CERRNTDGDCPNTPNPQKGAGRSMRNAVACNGTNPRPNEKTPRHGRGAASIATGSVKPATPSAPPDTLPARIPQPPHRHLVEVQTVGLPLVERRNAQHAFGDRRQRRVDGYFGVAPRGRFGVDGAFVASVHTSAARRQGRSLRPSRSSPGITVV